jgi:hypothetical protein
MFGTNNTARCTTGTYRVLYDAGINGKLADELATQRTSAVALTSRGHRPVAVVEAFEPSHR